MEDAASSPITLGFLDTPLSVAIREAVQTLPAILASPEATRSAKEVAVAVTAGALADAGEMDSQDPSLAPQMVDEAAISLDMQHDRTVEVALNATVRARHIHLAQALSNSAAAEAGVAKPSALARTEEAIGRAMRMRKLDPISGARLKKIISKMIETCITRSTRIDAMSDGELMTLVEDSCDAT